MFIAIVLAFISAAFCSDRWPRPANEMVINVENGTFETIYTLALNQHSEEIHNFFTNVVMKFMDTKYEVLVKECERLNYHTKYSEAFKAITGLKNSCDSLILSVFLDLAEDPEVAILKNNKETQSLGYVQAYREALSNSSDIYNYAIGATYNISLHRDGKKVATASYITGATGFSYFVSHELGRATARIHDNMTKEEDLKKFVTPRGILNTEEGFKKAVEDTVFGLLEGNFKLATDAILDYSLLVSKTSMDIDPEVVLLQSGNSNYATPMIFAFVGQESSKVIATLPLDGKDYERVISENEWRIAQSSDRWYDIKFGNDQRITAVQKKLDEVSDKPTFDNLYNTLRSYPARTNITAFIVVSEIPLGNKAGPDTGKTNFSLQKCKNIRDSNSIAACADPSVPFVDLWYVFLISLILVGVVIAFWVIGAKANKAYEKRRVQLLNADQDNLDEAAEFIVEDNEGASENSNELLELQD